MFRTGDARGTLLKVAQSAGMTEAQFNACVSDEKAAQALNDRVEASVKGRNITSTPTFIFNGKKVKEGEMTMVELDAAVAEAMKAQ
jgi:protein-disulfide isomerase